MYGYIGVCNGIYGYKKSTSGKLKKWKSVILEKWDFGKVQKWTIGTDRERDRVMFVCLSVLLVHICTFAFFQIPTLPIFHIYNFYFSTFPIFHLSTFAYPYSPLYTQIYPYKVVSTTNIALRIVLEFCTLLRGGVSKHPVLPTGHYLMYKTYSALF